METMQELGSAAALLLAGVFAWTAAAKLVAPARTAASFKALGLPIPGLFARGVPAAEAATTALLLVAPRAGGVLAIALLAAFSAFVITALRAGTTAGCGCFGAQATAGDDLSWIEPLRNLLLALLAALTLPAAALVRPGVSAVVAVGSLATSGFLGLGLVRLRRRVGAVWATPLPGSFPS